MAFSKIEGFEVTPVTPSSSTSRARSPPEIMLRRMKSSQIDCPHRCNAAIGFSTGATVACEVVMGNDYGDGTRERRPGVTRECPCLS